MNRLRRRLVDFVCRGLASDERDAVLGDLAELDTTARRALWEVSGLALRRQAALWTSKRPWLCLFVLVIPCGMLLGPILVGVSRASAIYGWLYFSNWTNEYLAAGFRADLFHRLSAIAISFLTLCCLAWCIGFAVGVLSQRAAAVNGAFLLFVVAFVQLASTWVHSPGNAAVFSPTLYRVILPSLLFLVLVFVPAFTGLRYGAKNYG